MDTTKIKTFFVNHFEKMILVGVIGASGYLMFQGFSLERFTDKHDPDKVKAEANRVKRAIDENHNENIIPPRKPELDIVARTKEIDTAVDGTPYKPKHLWQEVGSNSIVRRNDVQLKAPRAVVTTPVVTTIAWRGKTTPNQYPAYDLPPADAVEPAGRGGRNRGDREAQPDNTRRGLGGGLNMLRNTTNDEKRERKPREPDDEEEETVPARGFREDYNHGVVPKTTEGRYPEPRLARFIAGAAVVPHKELYQEFDLTFRDSADYQPSRDIPRYADFQVQRADVTERPVSELTDEDWNDIWDLGLYAALADGYWASYAPDLVPKDYRDDYLSNWIPPVLLDDYRDFIKHPLIPAQSMSELEQQQEDNLEDPVEETRDVNDLFASRADDEPNSPRQDDTPVEQEDEDQRPEYKLIRFYDFANIGRDKPKPGRKYVYRVRFAVNDPNFPSNPDDQPLPRVLAPEVAQRVIALNEKAIQTREREYRRWSPWSEPSAPVSLPPMERFYAGPVDPGSVNVVTVGGKRVEYERNPPEAKIVVNGYDTKYQVGVPFLLDVTEGSVLSHHGDAEVVDPIAMEVKKLENAKVQSSTTVIDLGGGIPLQITEKINQPGSMLIFDSSGRLMVADEVTDQEYYRIYSFADDRGE